MRKGVIKPSSVLLGLVVLVFSLTGCGGAGGDSSSVEASSGNSGKTAALSWNAPATRVNGEGLAMGELQGYVILYGQDADKLDRRIEISEASTMEYIVDNLSAGQWFFAIQVVDTEGLVSAPSEVVSKSI